MKITTKRLLYTSTIIIFFLAAPLILLYATGYRVSPATLSYRKVGALYIKSYPADAVIAIDGTSSGERTPGRLLNVQEGLHTVTISRAEYMPWKKNVTVLEGQTTFIETVQLIKETPEETLLSSGGQEIVLSPSGNAYAFINDAHEIVFTNAERATSLRIAVSVTPQILLAIAPSNDRLMFASGASAWILDINTERIKQIRFPQRSITQAEWDTHNPLLLWILSGTDVYTYDLTLDNYQLRKRSVVSFQVGRDGLAILTSLTDGTHLFELVDALTLDTLWSRTIPVDEPLTIASYDASFAIAHNQNTTYLISPDTLSSYAGSFYGIKKNLLLLYDGFEAITYSLTTHENTLVHRGSRKLRSLVWHPSGDYVLLHDDGAIQLLELDSRGHQERHIIATEPEAASVMISPDGSYLFIVTPTANRVLEIQ